jgi:hypothetical protein
LIEFALAYTLDEPLPNNTAYKSDFNLAKGSITGNQEFFETLGYTPPTLTKLTQRTETLKGRKLVHTKFKFRSWNIQISANELSPIPPGIGEPSSHFNKFNFLISFWDADYRYLAILSNLTTYPNYLEVEPDQDDFPLELLDNQLLLPEINFTLNEVKSYD